MQGNIASLKYYNEGTTSGISVKILINVAFKKKIPDL
jgi:hypothetical protein